MGCGNKLVFNVLMLLVVLCYGLSCGGKWAQAHVHHVVGDDRGWDLASDIASWAAGRTFAVGDFIWFAYSGGMEEDKVVELKSKEEFESCDLRNPIKMYTDGLDKIRLEEEGIRYFASSNRESCRRGLKLPVEVKSKSSSVPVPVPVLAEEPSSPSSSNKICGPLFLIIGGLFLSYAGL